MLEPMRWMMVMVTVAACAADQSTTPPETVVLNGTEVAVRDRELCSFYEWVSDRADLKEVPYIAPISGSAVVLGKLAPWLGASALCGDSAANPCPDALGDTWVNHVEELHLFDGTVRAGAFGNAILDHENWQDNPAWCEWRDAVELRQ